MPPYFVIIAFYSPYKILHQQSHQLNIHTMHPYQREILTSALEGREKELIEYQVNIDNYRLAIERISSDDEDLQPFRQQLQELLRSSLLEQRKSTIIRDVIAEQLAAE